MTGRVSFGLIGCGAAGKLHAQAMRESGAVDLRLVMDPEPRAARSLGEKVEVPWTTELDRLLEDRSIEAVSLAVPHYLHADLASRVARANKHILLEKPFTTSVQQAEALVALCRDRRVVIAPWFERRFLDYATRAREIIADGTIGKVVYTRVSTLGYKTRAYWQYGMNGEEYPSSWRSRRETSGGGVLIMNAIHQIDLMSYVTSLEVAEVSSQTATLHHEVEVEDIALVNVRYQSGALGMIEASCCTYGLGQFPIQGPGDTVAGTDGYLQMATVLKCFDRVRLDRQMEFPRIGVTEQKARQLENFAQHLREGKPLRVDATDAIRALAIVEAAYQSAATGANVTVGGIAVA